MEEAGTAVLVVNSNGANPDPVIVSYTVEKRDTQGITIELYRADLNNAYNWYCDTVEPP